MVRLVVLKEYIIFRNSNVKNRIAKPHRQNNKDIYLSIDTCNQNLTFTSAFAIKIDTSPMHMNQMKKMLIFLLSR